MCYPPVKFAVKGPWTESTVVQCTIGGETRETYRISSFISDNDIDILFLTESWLRPYGRLKPVWNDRRFISVQRYNWCAPLSHPFSCMLVNHVLSQQSSKEEYKPWKWGVPQDTTHLIQRPCYQRGSPCQDPADNWTTRRPDDRKETQTAVV